MATSFPAEVFVGSTILVPDEHEKARDLFTDMALTSLIIVALELSFSKLVDSEFTCNCSQNRQVISQ